MSYVPDPASATDPVMAQRYVLGELVGRGGMAEVYRGRDQLLERPVAVKVFRAHSDPVARRRFDEEAYALARLCHPGLALIFDVGVLADRPFLVMEFIDGENLQTRLLGGPLPPAEVVRIGSVLADALAHAHDRGVVHRDVKPANIMLDRDELPHLTDFGIALLSGAPRLTSVNAIVGTPAYVAPERLRGDEAGPPSDVYALGLVLLECLTGEVEYPADSNLACALARLSRPPRIPADLPAALADLLTAMTSTDPLDRPHAAECARQLSAAASELGRTPADAPAPTAVESPPWWADQDRGLVAPTTGTRRPATGYTRRRRRLLAAASVGTSAVAVALVFLINSSPSMPGQIPSGSSAGQATSAPGGSGGANHTGSSNAGRSGADATGSGPPAGRLVANEGPALTVVPGSLPSTTPTRPTTSPPPSSATPSPSPSSTAGAPTTSSPPPVTSTSATPGEGPGTETSAPNL